MGTEVPWLTDPQKWRARTDGSPAGDRAKYWRLARELCNALDDTAPDHASTDIVVRSADSVWLAFDLLATPREPQIRGQRSHTIPVGGAALPVVDSFNRPMRICWQHNGIRFRRLTALIAGADAGIALPVHCLPRPWLPLTVRSMALSTSDWVRVDADGDQPVIASSAVRRCPAWCQLPAGHDNWVPTQMGIVRHHSGAHRYAVGPRAVSVTIGCFEYVDAAGISWSLPEVALADATAPSKAEADFVVGLMPHIGAAVAAAAQPPPLRLQITGDRRLVSVPAHLCTRAATTRKAASV
ncbi:hypothetical protein [Nocardia sp. NPDC052566]|uniref:hypothetical protein n=1 Tax=Nocardia sp. NPDC052566 TaxID=3364330 RepID=UPI0037C9FEE1